MSKKMAVWLFLPALLLTISTASKDAAADHETFRVKSMSDSKVQIKFFAKSRNHVWPGTDRAYNLNDYEEHNIKLACESGEQICYGAWVTGDGSRWWGVGPDGNKGCRNCCYTCDNKDTRHIVLNPAPPTHTGNID
jgi:hypothetical protein